MKIRLTLKQLSRVLEYEEPKYPITFIMKSIDRTELEHVIQQLERGKRKF